MDEAERQELAARVLALAGGSSEAIVSDSDLGLTRFTHNAIHQNVAERDTVVRVRTVTDARTGVAATNDLSDSGLAAVVERAKTIAALAPREPDAPALGASPRIAAPAGAFDDATAAAGPDFRAALVAGVFASAERAALWAAGYVTTARSGITIANTAGTLQSFDGTSCGVNVKANGADATGFAEYYGNAVGELDGERVASVAVRKAQRGTAPSAVEPGAWTVILEPPALGELVSYLTRHFSAQSYDEGSSFLSDGLDRRYAGESLTIADDYAHPLFADMPFDYEGVPTRRLPLVERGMARHVVTDAVYAQRLGLPDTGHAEPAPSAAGPHARNIVISGGERSFEDLVTQTQRGLLVSRFWYIRPVDQRRTIVTGMTRDGTFLIEDGAIVRGVRNMRFNQSILEALANAEFSQRQVRTGGYAYAMVAPAAKIEGFHFTSATDF